MVGLPLLLTKSPPCLLTGTAGLFSPISLCGSPIPLQLLMQEMWEVKDELDMPQGPGRAHPPTDFLQSWSFAPPFNSICDFLVLSMLCNLPLFHSIQHQPPHSKGRLQNTCSAPAPSHTFLKLLFLTARWGCNRGGGGSLLPSRLPEMPQTGFLVLGLLP